MDKRPLDTRVQAPFGYPRVIGAYLAVNAVPDAWMFVDSADCATLRAEIIQDNHDWMSTLITEDGRYRIASSGVCPHSIVLDRRADLVEQIGVVSKEGGAFLFIYPAPITALVGIDYRAVLSGTDIPEGCQAMVIDPVDSVGHWVDGYEDIMVRMARGIQLPDVRKKDPASVALVGFLWDRNEWDCRASLSELQQLLKGLGLQTVSTWFSGAGTTNLAEVAKAGTIISLPYGREAARILAQRTGANLIETDLPMGAAGTVSWLKTLQERLSLSKETDVFIEKSAGECYRRIEKAVLRHLVDRAFLLGMEGHLAAGFSRLVDEFGGFVPVAAVSGVVGQVAGSPGVEVVLDNPGMEEVSAAFSRAVHGADSIAVYVGNERGLAALPELWTALVPMGFQAGGTHHLYPAPYLGFAGTVSLVDRISNAIALLELRTNC